MKIFTILATTVIAAVILGGCAMINRFVQSDESVRDEILEHLYQKYGVAFTAISLERGHSDLLTAFPTDGDRADVVRANRRVRDGDVGISDTFFGNIIREEIEEEVKTMLSGLEIPFRVIYPTGNTYYNNMFDGSKTYADFKQWIEDGTLWRFNVRVIISLDNIDDAELYANQIFEKISNDGFRAFIQVCVLPSEGFAQLTRTNLNDIIPQHHGQTAVISRSVN